MLVLVLYFLPARHRAGELNMSTSIIPCIGRNGERSRQTPTEAEGKFVALVSATGNQHLADKQSLVIEDYYCVSVKPPDVQGVKQTLQQDVIETDHCDDVAGVQSAPPSAWMTTLLSEEGPAQWLTSHVGLDRSDNLSMETAGETSDSDGGLTRRMRFFEIWVLFRTPFFDLSWLNEHFGPALLNIYASKPLPLQHLLLNDTTRCRIPTIIIQVKEWVLAPNYHIAVILLGALTLASPCLPPSKSS